MKTIMKSLSAMLLLAAGCGSDSGTMGGRCVQSTGCYEVQSPADYDVKAECDAFGGAWAQSTCDARQYTRRCTQTTQVNDASVVYVYYWPAGSSLTCLGTETNL